MSQDGSREDWSNTEYCSIGFFGAPIESLCEIWVADIVSFDLYAYVEAQAHATPISTFNMSEAHTLLFTACFFVEVTTSRH